MKFFPSINKKKPQMGFTYVEAIISITLTLIAAGAITFGVAKGVRTYKSLDLKENALQHLIRYTEEYRMMVAYGESPLPGKQPRNGHKVVLYNSKWENPSLFNWGGDEKIVEGTLFHIITDMSSETAGDQSGYYNIKTWIEWPDHNITLKDDVGKFEWKNIAFEVNQSILMK